MLCCKLRQFLLGLRETENSELRQSVLVFVGGFERHVVWSLVLYLSRHILIHTASFTLYHNRGAFPCSQLSRRREVLLFVDSSFLYTKRQSVFLQVLSTVRRAQPFSAGHSCFRTTLLFSSCRFVRLNAVNLRCFSCCQGAALPMVTETRDPGRDLVTVPVPVTCLSDLNVCPG